MPPRPGVSINWTKLDKFFAQVDAGASVKAAAAGTGIHKSSAFKYVKLRKLGKLPPRANSETTNGASDDRAARMRQAMDIAEKEGVPAAVKATGLSGAYIRERMEKEGRQWHLLRASRRESLAKQKRGPHGEIPEETKRLAIELAKAKGTAFASRKTGVHRGTISAWCRESGIETKYAGRGRRPGFSPPKKEAPAREAASGAAVSRAHAMITQALEPLGDKDRKRILRSVAIFYEQGE